MTRRLPLRPHPPALPGAGVHGPAAELISHRALVRLTRPRSPRGPAHPRATSKVASPPRSLPPCLDASALLLPT